MTDAKGVANALERFLSRAVAALVLECSANLTAAPSEGGTPIDTGWASANWLASIGTPASPPPTPTTREARASGAPSRAADQQTRLATVLTQYRIRLGPAYLINGVPYIVRLNEGSSRQAPSGFVQTAIVKAVRSVTQKLQGVGGAR